MSFPKESLWSNLKELFAIRRRLKEAPVMEHPWFKNETWVIIDSRTGKKASVAGFFSKEGAERQIEEWKERDRRGGRPDCHDSIPFLRPKKIPDRVPWVNISRDGRPGK